MVAGTGIDCSADTRRFLRAASFEGSKPSNEDGCEIPKLARRSFEKADGGRMDCGGALKADGLRPSNGRLKAEEGVPPLKRSMEELASVSKPKPLYSDPKAYSDVGDGIEAMALRSTVFGPNANGMGLVAIAAGAPQG